MVQYAQLPETKDWIANALLDEVVTAQFELLKTDKS